MQALQFSPLIVKELGGMSRRGRTYVVRTLYVVVTAFLVYGVAGPAVIGHRAIHTSEFADLGRRLFHAFTTLQMFFLPLASAVAASDMLHSEARRGTLPILLLTPLRPSGIVWGKWKAVMLYTSTLALSGLPVLGVAVYLGGVGPVDLLWSLSLSMAMSGVTAAMAIYYSVRDRTVVEAAIRAYLMLQLSVIPYGFVNLPLSLFAGRYALSVMAWLHPYFAWGAAANPAQSGVLGSFGWIGATFCTGYWCRRYLRNAIEPLTLTRQGSPFLDGPASGGPAPHEEMRARVRPPQLWENWPLLWKECATRTVRLPPASRAVLFIFLAFLTLLAVFNPPDGAIAQLYVLVPLALLLAVAIGAGNFAREKERRGFEMLLSAPIPSARLVGAKLLSGVMGMEVAATAVLIAIGFATRMSDRATRTASVTVPIFILFAYLLASWMSLRSHTYRTAFLGAAGVVLGILVGIPVVLGLCEGTPLAEAPAVTAFYHLLHPLKAVYSDLWPVQADSFLAGYVSLYLAACASLVAAMVFRFRALAGGR